MSGSRARRAAGFTLLEMMIALGILAISLTWLIEASMRAVDAENHARMLTTASLLARQVMVDMEDELQEKGIQDDAFASEKCDKFDDETFKRFGWCRRSDKITMPGQDAVQTAMGAAQGGGGGLGGGASPGSGLGGLGGLGGSAAGSANMLGSQFGLFKDVLEQGIRRATVRVTWLEHDREKVVEISQYLTDPRAVDRAVQIPSIPGVTTPNTPPPGGCPSGKTWDAAKGQCV